jgi:epoxyqueuosine reductase
MLPFIEKAKSLGFIAVGFTAPGRPLHFEHFRAWLDAGKNADMAWLARNVDVREDPSRMLGNCQTVISLAYPYPAVKPRTIDGFSVARYTNPSEEDYHTRLRSLCRELVLLIEGKVSGQQEQGLRGFRPCDGKKPGRRRRARLYRKEQPPDHPGLWILSLSG